MIQYCLIHDEWTTWGCRQCLKDELDKALEKSLAQLSKKFDDILSPNGRTRVRGGGK